MKCSACKINAHVGCISALMERQQLACKPTFRDVGVRQYREQTKTHHHWIHRRTEKGKCKQCGKVNLLLLLNFVLFCNRENICFHYKNYTLCRNCGYF